MADENTEIQEQQTQETTPQQQGIQFEDILPWGTTGGDTGLSSRLKLKRNFEKIKAWMDSFSQYLNLDDKYLSKTEDDEANGLITFLRGIKIGVQKLFGWDSNGDITANNISANDLSASSIRTDDIRSENYSGDGMADSGYRITSSWGNTTDSGAVFDYLTVRKKMIINSLEIKEEEFSAGDQAFTGANAKIARTDYMKYDQTSGKWEVIGYSTVRVPWLLRGIPLLLSHFSKGLGRKMYSRLKKVRMTLTTEQLREVGRIRCYFLANDGDREIENWWRVNDLARCQTQNLIRNQKRETYADGQDTHLGNIYYWRKVVRVSVNTGTQSFVWQDDDGNISQTYIEGYRKVRGYNGTVAGESECYPTPAADYGEPVTIDGKKYHWFEVSYDYAAELDAFSHGRRTSWCDLYSDIPAASDKVVQFGNTTDPDRMNVMTFEVNGSGNGDAPALKIYRGIYTFDKDLCWWGGNPRKVKISPATGYEFYGPMFKFVQEYGKAMMPIMRPEKYWTRIAFERDDEQKQSYPAYSDDVMNSDTFVSRADTTKTSRRYVRKCYYYDEVTHNGSLWMCSITEQYYWRWEGSRNLPYDSVTYEPGDRIPDGLYNSLPYSDKETCSRVRSYATSEPSEASNEWTLIVEKGDEGSSPISAYRWYEDGITPDTPAARTEEPAATDHTSDGKAYPADKWSKSAPNRQSEGWNLWMITSTKFGDGTVGAWSTPVRISGDKGTPGEDGSDMEYIYILKTSEYTFPTAEKPANISRGKVHGQGEWIPKADQYTTDDWVPEGWSDNPQGIDSTNKFEYMSWRRKPKGSNTWGAFQDPIIWSHWGRNGMDGDGTEYVFIRTKNEVEPIIADEGTSYLADEWRPYISNGAACEAETTIESGSTVYRTTDDPKGTNDTYKYEWVAKRNMTTANPTTGERTWKSYRDCIGSPWKMSLWGKGGENSIRLALDNEHEDFLYSKDGLVAPSGGATSQVHLYDGHIDKAADVTAWAISDDYGSSWGTTTDTYAEASFNTSTKVLSVTGLISNTAKVMVRARYNNQYYFANFTANKTTGDKYDIKVNPSSISFNTDDTWANKTITVTATGINGQGGILTPTIDTAATPVRGKFYIFYGYVLANGKIIQPSTESQAIPTEGTDNLRGTSFTLTQTLANKYMGIYFELRYYNTASEYRLCDYETVEIAKAENGKDGTSINVKGTLSAVVLASGTLPTIGINVGGLGIKQGVNQVYKYTLVGLREYEWLPYTAAADGDSYTMAKDCTIDLDGDGTSENIKGHLIMWSDEASKWIDLGQFKGDNGYTHIAWASGVTLGTTPSGHTTTGQTTTPNATSVTGFDVEPFDGAEWMGVLVNTETADSTDGLAYTWDYVKGPKGDDGKYKLSAYKAYDTAPTKPTGTAVDSSSLNAQGWYLKPSEAAANSGSAVTLTYTPTGTWTRSSNTFTSPSNTQDQGYYQTRISFTTVNDDIRISLRLTASSETNYDFGYIGNLDTDLSSSVGNNYIARASGTESVDCVLNIAKAGSHYFDIVYKKDGSTSQRNDNAVVQILGASNIVKQIWECETWVDKDSGGTEYAVGWSDPVKWNGIDGKDGSDGNVGKTGRFYYFAGVYNGTPSSYVMQETQAPFVKNGNDFWMLDFKGNEPSSIPAAATDAPSVGSQSWSEMASEQQYYIAKAVFGDYAQFGAFLINGDWQLSTYGRICGKQYNTSSWDDPAEYTGTNSADKAVAYTTFDPLLMPTGIKNFGGVGSFTNTSYTTVKTISPSLGKRIIRITGSALGSAVLSIKISHNGYERVLTITNHYATPVVFVFDVAGSVAIQAKSSLSDTSVTISAIEQLAFVPDRAIDGKTGSDYGYSITLNGILKAYNIQRNVLFYWGSSNASNYSKNVYYVQGQNDWTEEAGYEIGDYILEDDVVNSAHFETTNLKYCTYDADVIICSVNQSGYDPIWGPCLPHPKDFIGKMIDIIFIGSGSGYMWLQCVNTTGDGTGSYSDGGMCHYFSSGAQYPVGEPVVQMTLDIGVPAKAIAVLDPNGKSRWLVQQWKLN